MAHMLPKLYVRKENFYTDISIIPIGKGPNKSYELTLEYENPGWIAFDFACDVEDYPEGKMAEGRLDFFVNDIHRFRARGSYTFTRIYVYVNRGLNHFKWTTNEDFRATDEAWLKRINGTSFDPSEEYSVIQNATPPKRLNEIHRQSIINGYDRFQQSGPGGVEIDLMITFAPKMVENEDGEMEYKDSIQLLNDFMETFPNFYVLEYNYGLYGGTILDPQPANESTLQHIDCVFHSPQRISADRELLEI